MRSRLSPRCLPLASLLALWTSLAAFVPAALSQTAAPRPELWSIQLHTGAYLPRELHVAGQMAGMRYSKHFNSHVSGGLLTSATLISETLDQSDGSIGYAPEVELARVDAKLYPVMGFLQVDLTDRFFLVPYLGIGAGYEWLVIDALDHRTATSSRATFAGFAWESYGGAGLRLNSRMRVTGELYYNGGLLKRRVVDESGHPWFEAVESNGIGMRVGMDMIFE